MSGKALTAWFVLGLAARGAAAQGAGLSLGLAGVATGGDPAYVGAGAAALVRLDSQLRLRTLWTVGSADRRFGTRGETTLDLVVNPSARGWSMFAGGGLAIRVDGEDTRGYLLLTGGLEQRPAGPRGWWIEAGVGGGVRLAAGYRWAVRHGRRPGSPS